MGRHATFLRVSLAAGLLLASALVGCMAHMHPGQSLLKRRCSSCHAPRPAAELRGGKLDRVLEGHKDKVKLPPAELEQIRAYLDKSAASGR